MPKIEAESMEEAVATADKLSALWAEADAFFQKHGKNMEALSAPKEGENHTLLQLLGEALIEAVKIDGEDEQSIMAQGMMYGVFLAATRRVKEEVFSND